MLASACWLTAATPAERRLRAGGGPGGAVVHVRRIHRVLRRATRYPRGVGHRGSSPAASSSCCWPDRTQLSAGPEMLQCSITSPFTPSSRHDKFSGSNFHDVENTHKAGGDHHMSTNHKILIFGASYGSLLATKLILAGHDATLVCLPEEADLINGGGTRVRIPVRGRDGLVEIDSRKAPGTLSAAAPGDVNPADFDLVALAMQEPQYRAPEVRRLLDAVARVARAVHVHHEHAAACLPEAPAGPGRRLASRLLHRRLGLGQLRPRHHHPGEPRPPGLPPARGAAERAPGEPAHQLQGGPLRIR